MYFFIFLTVSILHWYRKLVVKDDSNSIIYDYDNRCSTNGWLFMLHHVLFFSHHQCFYYGDDDDDRSNAYRIPLDFIYYASSSVYRETISRIEPLAKVTHIFKTLNRKRRRNKKTWQNWTVPDSKKRSHHQTSTIISAVKQSFTIHYALSSVKVLWIY